MAHGKHRRSRATTQRNPKMTSFKARLSRELKEVAEEMTPETGAIAQATDAFGDLRRKLEPARELAAKFILQERMVHDGDHEDATEQVFNLMACVHPSTCTCETDYPNWRPGMR